MSGFDTAAVREWADQPLPDDPRERLVMWNQLRTDVIEACDYIDELEAALAEARAAS
jgi:hypothetical protein